MFGKKNLYVHCNINSDVNLVPSYIFENRGRKVECTYNDMPLYKVHPSAKGHKKPRWFLKYKSRDQKQFYLLNGFLL